MQESKGRKLHGLAETARERGDFIESLKYTDEAIIAYQEENDHLGFSELQGSRYLIFNHLFEKTGFEGYKILGKFSALSAVELAEKSGNENAKALPYHNLAKAYQSMNDYSNSILFYKKAIEYMEKYPPHTHVDIKDLEVYDMKAHLAFVEYISGDKGARARLNEAIAGLEATPGPSYQKDVWASGAHMRMAQMLKDEDLENAKLHLENAKQIIDKNSDLKLRKEQWEKLAKSFS